MRKYIGGRVLYGIAQLPSEALSGDALRRAVLVDGSFLPDPGESFERLK